MDMYKLDKAKNHIYIIQDNLRIMRNELNTCKPQKEYCLEKIELIKTNLEHLELMFKKEE